MLALIGPLANYHRAVANPRTRNSVFSISPSSIRKPRIFS